MSRNRNRQPQPALQHSAALQVTDHALVRFLERAGGVDVEALRANLAAGLARSATAARMLGATDYLITADGHTYVVRQGKVTTMLSGKSTFALDHAPERLSDRASDRAGDHAPEDMAD